MWCMKSLVYNLHNAPSFSPQSGHRSRKSTIYPMTESSPIFVCCSDYRWPWTRTCSFSRCCIRGFQQCTTVVVKNDAAQHHDGPMFSHRVSRWFSIRIFIVSEGELFIKIGFVFRQVSWAEIDRNIRLRGCSGAHARFLSRDFGKYKYVWKCKLRVWIIGKRKLEPCVKIFRRTLYCLLCNTNPI